ncbi:unnamed protein product [Gemmata massiliana]|uniref:Lipoprotein n=1 Tax=Gemmata massiliana TaxID=1210884 RepID=A0A6P2DEH6_9BACT|nr:hypothetical protein [Gemmata massiliana]VTR99084.1 unnamed protein product [Gemmata massiliana]
MNRLCFLFLGLGVLCGCSDRMPPDDSLCVQGEWIVVDFRSPKGTEDRGQRRKHAIISEETWSEQFLGDRFEDFEYTIDPNKSPKELDLIQTDPSGNRLTVRAIYELIDNERLRVCIGSPPVVEKDGKPEFMESVRPTDFTAKDGPLISYRRKTKRPEWFWSPRS